MMIKQQQEIKTALYLSRRRRVRDQSRTPKTNQAKTARSGTVCKSASRCCSS